MKHYLSNPHLLVIGIVGVLSIGVFGISRPSFRQLLEVNPTQAASLDTPDLDVTYIERTPRYYRYDVIYENDVPKLRPGTENNQRWPNVGEQITYTAHVQNKGRVAVPAFSYNWKVDGAIIESNNHSGLEPAQEVTFSYQTTWTDAAQKIDFVVDTGNQVSENSENNNELTLGSRDLTFEIFVEKGLYDIFSSSPNLVGTYSFEDWIQKHFETMHEKFGQAKYPAAPNGIADKIRIDRIVIADELDGPTSPLNNNPDLHKYDGRWQFVDGDATNAEGINGEWQSYFNNHGTSIDWGLNHELTHQLGVIDLYRFNLKNDPADNNGIHVLGSDGQEIPVSQLPTYAHNEILFQYGGLMGAGDTSPYRDVTYYESHTAAGMNRHTGVRRGFYGEYLFDTPQTTQLKVLYSNNEVLSNAQVSLYQKGANESFDNTPEITGTTNADGVLTLPNRAVTGVTTITGHTLRANPFGQINVVGTNGTMLMKVTKNGQTGYGWLLLHDLNLAYWSGDTDTALITLKSTLSVALDPTNRALNKPAISNRTDSIGGHEPAKAVDGDTTTQNSGWQVYNPVRVGDWIQVDMGSVLPVSKINVYPSAQNYADMCDMYHIDLSSTGAFTGEQTRVATEVSAPHIALNSYNFPSVNGRYVRLTCDMEQNWVQLQEIEVFGPVVTETPTPSPTPSPSPSRSPTPTRSPSPTPRPTTSPRPIVTPTPKPVAVVIRALGTGARNTSRAMEFPTMYLKLNGQRAKLSNGNEVKWTVTNSFKNYTYTSALPVTQLELEYTNDAENDLLNDRALRVDHIQLANKTYQTESQTTYSVGSWSFSNGCGGGFKSSEWLNCAGYFRYQL